MNRGQIEKLQTLLGPEGAITAEEIGRLRLAQLESTPGVEATSCDTCVMICEWIITRAATAGSCAAGELMLSGLFVLADIVFFEAVEILVPLEIAVDAAWAIACDDVGIAIIGKNAAEYARDWCEVAGLC